MSSEKLVERPSERLGEKPSERQCVVTRMRGNPAVMIRFVAAPDGVLTPDLAGRLPGRGAWVQAQRQALEKGGGLIMRAAGARRLPDDLPDMLGVLLLRRLQEVLSLGRRAGHVIGGGGKIRAARAVRGLLMASDASGREGRALLAAVDHDWVEGSLLTSDELGAAFGRGGLAFAAVCKADSKAAGRFEKRLRDEITRLSGFRPI